VFGFFFSPELKSDQAANFNLALSKYNDLWYYPVLVFIVFIVFLMWVKNTLDKRYYENKLTKNDVTKLIDKYSGVVDGIGTALPLIGAAIILYTVGLGSDTQELFLHFAIPFEIKSLFILAIAKLIESAFDDMEIQYLKYAKDNNDAGSLISSKIEFVNLPNNADIKEINDLLTNWNQTVDKMKDPEFSKNLETIKKIVNK